MIEPKLISGYDPVSGRIKIDGSALFSSMKITFIKKASSFAITRLLFGVISFSLLTFANIKLGSNYGDYSVFLSTVLFFAAFEMGCCVSISFQYKKHRDINPVIFIYMSLVTVCIFFWLPDRGLENSMLFLCIFDVWLSSIIFQLYSSKGNLIVGEIIRGGSESLRQLLLIYFFLDDHINYFIQIIFILSICIKVSAMSKYVRNYQYLLLDLRNNCVQFYGAMVKSMPMGASAIAGSYLILGLKNNLVDSGSNIYHFDITLKILSVLLVLSTPIFFTTLRSENLTRDVSEKLIIQVLPLIIIALIPVTIYFKENYIVQLLFFILAFGLSGWMDAFFNGMGRTGVVLIINVLRVSPMFIDINDKLFFVNLVALILLLLMTLFRNGPWISVDVK